MGTPSRVDSSCLLLVNGHCFFGVSNWIFHNITRICLLLHVVWFCCLVFLWFTGHASARFSSRAATLCCVFATRAWVIHNPILLPFLIRLSAQHLFTAKRLILVDCWREPTYCLLGRNSPLPVDLFISFHNGQLWLARGAHLLAFFFLKKKRNIDMHQHVCPCAIRFGHITKLNLFFFPSLSDQSCRPGHKIKSPKVKLGFVLGPDILLDCLVGPWLVNPLGARYWTAPGPAISPVQVHKLVAIVVANTHERLTSLR